MLVPLSRQELQACWGEGLGDVFGLLKQGLGAGGGGSKEPFRNGSEAQLDLQPDRGWICPHAARLVPGDRAGENRRSHGLGEACSTEATFYPSAGGGGDRLFLLSGGAMDLPLVGGNSASLGMSWLSGWHQPESWC